ncbi:MAG TPA: PLP-dependent aspartate aminotransferase family protein [Thermoanaerobaculia bacterium]|nr:PLP-dependent aspartate aminotransferase family protein [Thermoanaerobaculia bacterium]
MAFATRAIHAGQAPDPKTGAVTVPIYQTSTYSQASLGENTGFEYARSQNPTRFALEDLVASLEGGAKGHAFASGMAAIACLMTILKAGDHVVVSQNVYGGTFRYFTRVLEKFGLSFSWIDTTSLEAVEAAITPATRMVYLETPSNPLMEVTDIAAVSEVAHAHGAKVAVDNTFLSPYFQLPLELGADFVVHSTTKFLNGHSDSISGVLISKSAEDGEWFTLSQKSAGGILAPFECFLVMRGIKTLAVRMERHEANTMEIVDFLGRHRAVRGILYPGLPTHPGFEIQKRQASGFGSMISIELGSYGNAKAMLDRVRLWALAESLGGVESLISHPASMTHASIPLERRNALGITEGLVRLSVGIEDVGDLRGDLEQALDAVPA